MATTRLMPLHNGKGRKEGRAIRDIIGYVSNPDKTEQGELVTAYACDPRTADAEFLLAKREYISRTGRVRGKDDVIAYHMRQSFVPGEITAVEANRIGQELANRFTHGHHAFIVATHTDKAHIHNHIIIHAVNLDCNRKFRNFWGSTKALRQLSDTLCVENGLSVVENPKGHGNSYDKWLGDRTTPSQRDALRRLIDGALSQHPDGFDTLLSLLKASGCDVKQGKTISLRGPGQTRFKRLDTLGTTYDESSLRAVLSGVKSHQTYVSCPISAPKMSLLIDIQEKLREGKGPGYERWAKTFNMKQMAQTLNYISEYELRDHNALREKSLAATEACGELLEKLKRTETRLNEIAALKMHIINYIKTRDVYIAYRKAGYSKKFFAEYESDILLHQAAKKAFDDLQLPKVPTIRSLQNEYAELLVKKKKDYTDYRKARHEMRQLLIARANVERLLGDEELSNQQQKKIQSFRDSKGAICEVSSGDG